MSRPKIKCVVWDLDHTIWNGVLLEGDTLALRPGVRELVELLDRRGILQSIASKNDAAAAWAQVEKFGLGKYFLHPQIGWGSKSQSIQTIAKRLNIGIDTLAFVDDQAFERDEVTFAVPEVRAYDSADVASLADLPDFTPKQVTADAQRRREMYQADLVREQEEKSFKGPSDAFLSTLGMVLTVAPAAADDLPRVEELVTRTNQLNTTGRIYDYAELEALRVSSEHELLVAELTDKHGSYGKIGVILIERAPDRWTIKLLLMSCRVMSRGVGGALITLLRQQAREAGVRLVAEFRATERNRMMYITYKFAGFSELGEAEGSTLLEADLTSIPELPAYLRVDAIGQGGVRG